MAEGKVILENHILKGCIWMCFHCCEMVRSKRRDVDDKTRKCVLEHGEMGFGALVETLASHSNRWGHYSDEGK